ncbi:MAG: polysaccharide deacetylase family protein [Bacteroidota bacterium]|nr:polysaccharide deacetylase family protein [Flavisolibacter sp.]MDQ3845821.1 polysaccharide deacetylase family protein [Bacteroidota bacterium]MBD0284605.1 polysaccharide deacetylase family protein [Flavisolibacter sp.]MBD0297232.1 polysaccharide deacetylase family protein [Flavisolibacter sp.]MBD0365983.1 polysaccharide deacetylase family protein [Flavisolibacter sp.]
MNNTNPDKLVVLTFDDASLIYYARVASLLKQYGFDAPFLPLSFRLIFKNPQRTDKCCVHT